MKLLINLDDLNKYKSRDGIPLQCKQCLNTFYLKKHLIQNILRGQHKSSGDFCSSKCVGKNQNKSIECSCAFCDKIFMKRLNQIKRTKNNFCNSSCAASYNNTHKIKGCRRSKLEVYLEKELSSLYPQIKIEYNKTSTIEAELDFYLPDFKLAFELNGIFHYEPIYGLEKLNNIQRNDKQKILKCAEKGIELCVIDSTSMKYFKESNAKKFLNIFTKIIDDKLKSTHQNSHLEPTS